MSTRDIDRYRALTQGARGHRSGRRPLSRIREGGGRPRRRRSSSRAIRAMRDVRRRGAHAAAQARIAALEGELQAMLLPKDPNDERNVFLEIRAGTGGDESALFAGDLFRMYARYAERQRWQVEIVSESPAELGGYKEVIVRIVGAGRLLEAQVRIRRPSRAARARDRGAGAHPHVGVHGRRAAGGRPDRRHHDQSRRPAHRHVPRVGRRRPARQQDRLGGAHHAPADRPRRRMPGRPLAAPQPRAGDVGARLAAARPRAPRAAAEGGGAPQVADRLAATAASASAPTIFRRAASPITGST